MKLYYTPGACSLAPHIVSREAGVAVDLVKVDLANHTTETGEDFTKIHKRGYVPALDIGQGEPLSEASVLVQYLADQGSNRAILPAHGTIERLRVQQWLAMIATELHKGFAPLWNPATPADFREITKQALHKRFADLDAHLAKEPYLTGQNFTVADAYAYVILRWTQFHKIVVDDLSHLMAFARRIEERPAVKAALEAEGVPAVAG